ncbi:vanomycin resistance protein VanB [Cellulomonas sp. APG4]|uniref:VanW family protein n=1 Tax=Cellulomonas sp. APG4 TaxID=1538656 RepID=UPI001379C8A9|nr:vanomycin resistance protein VanB [Cellulomonas sp. APG4]
MGAPEPTPAPEREPTPEGASEDVAPTTVPSSDDVREPGPATSSEEPLTAAAPQGPGDVSSSGDDATVVLPPVPSPAEAPRRTSALGRHEEPSTEPAATDPTEAEASAPSEPTHTHSPIDVFPDDERSRRWPRVLGIAAAVVVVLGGLYVGALWLWSDRVPPGTTVAGVEVGGLTADQAVSLLDEQLAAAETEPVPVSAGDKRTTLDPVVAGLTADHRATVEGVTGFGLEPARLWRQVFGGDAVPPVTEVDEAALDAALTEVAEGLESPPVDGTVVFVDGAPQSTASETGTGVDVEAAERLLVDEWLTAPRPVELPTEVLEPAIDDAEVERALAELARPLVDAPVTVTVGESRAELPAEVLAAHASLVPEGEALVLELDGEALVEEVVARIPDLLSEPTDARFEFVDGAPVIQPGVPGTTLDPEAVATALAAVATSGADRTAALELVETDPAESTAALEALGVVEVVSEFSTPLTSEPRRTKNIINGASKVNGTLVRPDEEFSLTEALGPVDGVNGFVQAGAIVNGEHTDAWGGGLSQLSTTTYNAAYFAGFEDVEHHPHSEWFARYPEGREATIFTGTLDMRFRNTTPYGALLQAYVTGGRLHVRVWSTPHFEVESSTSGRSNVVSPTTVYSSSPTCAPQSAGNPGFTVTVTRVVRLEGEEVDRESWTVRYRPQNRVVCGEPPSADDDEDEDE